MNLRGHLLRETDGVTIGFGLDLSGPYHVDREAQLEALERIFAAERVPIVWFEDEAIDKKWAHVFAQDDLEHHAADVFVGTIGREGRYATSGEIAEALAQWSGREPDAFEIHCGGKDGEERANGAS